MRQNLKAVRGYGSTCWLFPLLGFHRQKAKIAAPKCGRVLCCLSGLLFQRSFPSTPTRNTCSVFFACQERELIHSIVIQIQLATLIGFCLPWVLVSGRVLYLRQCALMLQRQCDERGP